MRKQSPFPVLGLAGPDGDAVLPQTFSYEKAPALSAAVTLLTAYLQSASCSGAQIVGLLRDLHDVAFAAIEREKLAQSDPRAKTVAAGEKLAPSLYGVTSASAFAVPVGETVFQDYIVCLEDGKKVKSLKRYLRSHFGMTTDQYKIKWGLPSDYPMVAPALSAKRAHIARKVKPHLARRSAEAVAALA